MTRSAARLFSGPALFLAAALAARSFAAAPTVLVVQGTTGEHYGQNFDLSVAPAVTQSLYEEGRVSPVLWSLTDALFRAAVEDKLISRPSTDPKMDEIRDVALKLKIDYILILKAVRDRQQVNSEAKLYQGDKVIWQDKKDLAVTKDGALDVDGTAASLARTWCLAMGSGPFKDLPTKRRETPNMDPGSGRTVVVPDPPRKVDNAQLAKEAAELAKSNQVAQLMVLLRDAVDAEPMDTGRRRMLIDYLGTCGMKELAADEAKRAAMLLPESAEFHVLAARAYMETGDAARAQAELNEAIAREPESFETRLLLGELSLSKLELQAALDHFNGALAKGSTPDALYKRALTYALLGNAEAAKKDAADAQKGTDDPSTVTRRYDTAVMIADAITVQIGVRVRNLIQKARMRSSDPEVATEWQAVSVLSAGLTQVVGMPVCPPRHQTSHDRRVLALNLLAQCIAQIGSCIKDRDADVLTEASINLGEALKQAESAKDAYRSEMQSSAG